MKEISELIEMLKDGDGGYTPAPAVRKSTTTIPAKPAPAPAPTAVPVQTVPTPQAAPQPSRREAIEFNIDNINANMEKLKVRFKRISPATSIAFSDAQIVRAENDILELGIQRPSFYSTLSNQKEEVEHQLSDFFGKPIRLIIKQIKNSEPHKLPDSRRNINSLKEKDPILAEYITLTNSKLGAGS
ncbi:MAG: hypothetical protein GX122_02800 [Candidatus Cloacimonetes bacterium]|nr:hypothetical protein [Candidatus Cloacimonadota bacterium]